MSERARQHLANHDDLPGQRRSYGLNAYTEYGSALCVVTRTRDLDLGPDARPGHLSLAGPKATSTAGEGP